MGNTASVKVRPPEVSINPILAAQARAHSSPAEWKAILRVQLSQEPSMAALLGHAMWCHSKVAEWSKLARMRVPTRHSSSETLKQSRLQLALLLFLARACRLERYGSRSPQEGSAQGAQRPARGQRRSVGKRTGVGGRTKGSSKYKGLSWHKGVGKWAVQLRINGANQQLGYYANEEEAARVYDHWVIRTRPSHAETNFPRPANGNENDGGYAPTVSLQRRASREGNGEVASRRGSGGGRGKQSRFRGVTFDKISQRWRAQVWMFNKAKNLGSYNSEHDAALAYDRALIDAGVMDRGFNLPAAADNYISEVRPRSGWCNASKRAGVWEQSEQRPRKRFHGANGESSQGNSRVMAGESAKDRDVLAGVTSPQHRWLAASPASSEQRSTPESDGFIVPVRTASGETSDFSRQGDSTRLPDSRPRSPSPAPNLDALASLCDAEADKSGNLAVLVKTEAAHSPQPRGAPVGGIRGLVSRIGPLSPTKRSAAVEHPQDPGSMPAPMPRMRQRKPEKRKRVDTISEPDPVPRGRGRGRPRGSRNRGRGRMGNAARGIGGGLAMAGESSGKRSFRFKGILWNAAHQQWRAMFWHNGQVHHVGYFNNEEAAARAYDAAAIEAGAAVTLNFPLTIHNEARAQPRSRSRAASPSRPTTRAAPETRDDPDYEPNAHVRRDASEPPMSRRDSQPGVIGAAALAKFGRMIGRADSDHGAASSQEDDDWQARRQPRGGRGRGRGRSRLSRPTDGQAGMVIKVMDDVPRRRGRPPKQSRPRYRGVSWEEDTQMWIAELRHLGKTYFIGRYETELDASKAYDSVGVEKFGPMFPVNHRPEGEGPRSQSESDSDSDAGGSLLPPLPRWGCRLRLATHTPAADTSLVHDASLLHGRTQAINRSPNGPKPLQARRQHHAKPGHPGLPMQHLPSGPTAGLAKPGTLPASTQSQMPQPSLLHHGTSPRKDAPKASLGSLVSAKVSAVPQPKERGGESLPVPVQPPQAVSKKPKLVPTSDGHLRLSGEAGPSKPGAPGPSSQQTSLRLVESGGRLHLATTDPNSSSAILAALGGQIGQPGGPRPATSQTEPSSSGLSHVLTLPERARSVLAKLQKQREGKTLSVAELLAVFQTPSAPPPLPGSQPQQAEPEAVVGIPADMGRPGYRVPQSAPAPQSAAMMQASCVASQALKNQAPHTTGWPGIPVSQGSQWDPQAIAAADMQRSLQLSTAKMVAEANRNAYAALVANSHLQAPSQAENQAGTRASLPPLPSGAPPLGTSGMGPHIPATLRKAPMQMSQPAMLPPGSGFNAAMDQLLQQPSSGLVQGPPSSSSGLVHQTPFSVLSRGPPASTADKAANGQRPASLPNHSNIPPHGIGGAPPSAVASLNGGWRHSVPSNGGSLQSLAAQQQALRMGSGKTAGKRGVPSPPPVPSSSSASPPWRISSRKDAAKEANTAAPPSGQNLATSNVQKPGPPSPDVSQAAVGRFKASNLTSNRIMLGGNGVMLPHSSAPSSTPRTLAADGAPGSSSLAPVIDASRSESQQAQVTSRYLGVTFDNGRWRANFHGWEGPRKLDTTFETELEAARAYDIGMQLLHRGEDVELNFPAIPERCLPIENHNPEERHIPLSTAEQLTQQHIPPVPLGRSSPLQQHMQPAAMVPRYAAEQPGAQTSSPARDLTQRAGSPAAPRMQVSGSEGVSGWASKREGESASIHAATAPGDVHLGKSRPTRIVAAEQAHAIQRVTDGVAVEEISQETASDERVRPRTEAGPEEQSRHTQAESAAIPVGVVQAGGQAGSHADVGKPNGSVAMATAEPVSQPVGSVIISTSVGKVIGTLGVG